LGACPVPATAKECVDLYNRYARRQADPPGTFGEGGFLELACRVLYGPKAGKHMERLSDKWPMPNRATWGEIEQEIAVQPGRTYVVAFSVFNNYGLSRGSGVCEHLVLVDDQERWSLDASSPKGWKSGGFLVTPKTSKMRLRLRTTDVRPCGGWRPMQGDSWWDHVRIYPLKADTTTH
jgi:hypothetical protein